METKKELIQQIVIVINILEKDYDITNGILEELHQRYLKALKILEGNKEIQNINIDGGVRAYLDSFSDYTNALLAEMHRAEKLFKELNVWSIELIKFENF